jgi:hypothetical protein
MTYARYAKTRSVRLTITTPDGQTITVENMVGDEGFRMAFDCRRTMDETPGEFQVTIWNMDPEAIAILNGAQTTKIDDIDQIMVGKQLQSATVAEDGVDAQGAGFFIVELEAGYDEQVSRVFKAIGARIKTGPDSSLITTVTTITAQEDLDGMLLGLPMTTFTAGTPTFELVDYLRNIAGLGPGNLTPATMFALLGDSKLDCPFHVSGGQALDFLQVVLKWVPLRWFVDDRQFWVCGREGVSPPGSPPPWIVDGIGLPEPLLSPPQRDDAGRIVAECFLCPRLKVGRLVELSEAGLSLTMAGLSPQLAEIQKANVPPGLYRLDEVSHAGDTGGGDWTTRMLLRATKGA